MDALDDDALIVLARRGDSQAFADLVERHYAAIFRIAYRWCGNREDAEDITQEACIRLGRGVAGFRGDSRFTSWLYRLVLNAAKDWQKRNTRSRHSDARLEDAADVPEPANIEDRLYARQVLTAVTALPATEKEAVILVFAEGLTHREAASVLGCAEATVSWRIHSARKRLGRALDRGYEEHERG